MRHTFLAIVVGFFLSVPLFTACSSEDSFETNPTTQNNEVPIEFGSYLNRSVSTRGSAYFQIKDIAESGIGLYAMYTKGGRYNNTSTTAGDKTEYEANYMQNFQLHTSLSSEELNKASASSIAESWVYSPLRYWPITSEEYLSFMAYAPYSKNTKLTDKAGNESGDMTYIKHEVSSDPKNHTDLLYADASGITNMQLYPTNATGNGTTWEHNGDFYGLDGQTNVTTTTDKRGEPLVNLKLKHATARLGFIVTSSAIQLTDASNYQYTESSTDETTGETTTVNKTPTSGGEATSAVSGKMSITVNKVELLGDNTSANSDSPTGAFYPSAYLNLSSSSAEDLWNDQATDNKLVFIYDNTSTIRTLTGEYKASGDGTISATTSKYTWLPSDLTSTTGSTSKTISGTWETETDESGNVKFKSVPTINVIGNGGSDYMFVIPQDFTEEAPLYAYLDFTLNYGDKDNNTQNFKVYRPIVKKFEAGHAYIIIMNIESLTSIQFSVEEVMWPDEILVGTTPQF